MKTSLKQKIEFYFIKLSISFIAILFTAWLLDGGIHIGEPKILNTILIAVILACLNTFLKPILVALTIPVSLFTFGFFILIINALMIILVDVIVPDFTVDSFGYAFFFAILVSIVSTLLDLIGKIQIVKNQNKKEFEDSIHNRNNQDNDDFIDYEDVSDQQ